MSIYGLINIFRLVLNAKKVFSNPKKKDILLFDNAGKQLLFNFIDENSTEILYIRGEELNIPIFIASFFSVRRYIKKYILAVSPRYVITYTDNNKLFYKIKFENKNITTIFIQNGLRTEIGDIFSSINIDFDCYQVDYMFVFNSLIADKYKEYIKGNAIVIGSIKNNKVQLKINIQNNKLLFVSQYTVPPHNNEDMHYVTVRQSAVSWSKLYETDRIIVEHLRDYCIDRNIEFCILGRSQNAQSKEKEFYNKIIKNSNWLFVENNKMRNVYSVIDDYECIVGIDSTLLYEAFARRKKVVFFSARGQYIGEDVGAFGWPGVFSERGFFWSSIISKDIVYETIGNTIAASKSDWAEIYNNYKNSIMEYDSGNKNVIAVLKNIGIPMVKKSV
jgi:surface carbohydrate biosynthesis protein